LAPRIVSSILSIVSILAKSKNVHFTFSYNPNQQKSYPIRIFLRTEPELVGIASFDHPAQAALSGISRPADRQSRQAARRDRHGLVERAGSPSRAIREQMPAQPVSGLGQFGPIEPPGERRPGMVRRGQIKALSAAIAATVLLMSGCAPIQGRESAGEYVDDATVSTKVRAELLRNQSLKGFDIHVETMQDVVQLSGFVDSPTQKAQAEQIARSVSGVRGVRNDIVVRAG
jgi:hypothetical protein